MESRQVGTAHRDGIQIHEVRARVCANITRPWGAYEVEPLRREWDVWREMRRILLLVRVEPSLHLQSRQYRSDTLRPLIRPSADSSTSPAEGVFSRRGGANKRYRITYVALGGASANKLLGPGSRPLHMSLYIPLYTHVSAFIPTPGKFPLSHFPSVFRGPSFFPHSSPRPVAR